jgi:hypothetical protein
LFSTQAEFCKLSKVSDHQTTHLLDSDGAGGAFKVVSHRKQKSA